MEKCIARKQQYGYVIRDEEVIETDEQKSVVQIKNEGEKVAKDEIVYRYNIDNEDTMNNQIKDLTMKIQEALEGQTDLYSSDIKALETQIDEEIEGMKEENNIQNIREYKNNITTSIVKKAKIAGALSTSEKYINSLIDEKEQIENQLKMQAEYIHSPMSGMVSYRIDGLENTLKCGDFSYIDSTFLKNLNLKTGQIINTSINSAKIVNNYKCYIATILETEEAQNIKTDKNLKIRLYDNSEINAKVVYKKDDGTSTIVVFEIHDCVDKLIELRKISIDVIWWETDGLKIPKKSIFYDSGLAYVKRNRAGYQEQILVKIIEENDEYCIVENYTTEELQKLNFTTEEIQNYKKIRLYDEIILNPTK